MLKDKKKKTFCISLVRVCNCFDCLVLKVGAEVFVVLQDICAVSPYYLWNYHFWPVTHHFNQATFSVPLFNLLLCHYHNMVGQADMFLFYFTAF